ncbi:MAG: CocE/NonD family hydrolase [Acidobacteriota bacterium]
MVLVLLPGLAPELEAQRRPGNPEIAEYVRANYTKTEVQIPMRDGVRLFTSIYTPNNRSQRYPILMMRTPYSVGPYGADEYRSALGPSAAYAKDGYIFVYQDVRGTFLSEGTFVNMRPHNGEKARDEKGAGETDESTDTYDTIEWLLAHVPGHNGKVGQYGTSYPGFYTAAGAIDSHPALKAISPQAPIADWWWDDMHRHGAFNLNLSFSFFSSFGVARPEPTTDWAERFDFPTPDGYQFFLDLGPLKNVNEKYFEGEIEFWNEIIAHPNRDEFWTSRDLLPHLDGIEAAVLTVGGWYDTEDLYGPLNIYRSIEEKNPGIYNVLVMGPWSHGAWNRNDGDGLGDASFGFKTSLWYRDKVERPFFQHFLKGDGSSAKGGESAGSRRASRGEGRIVRSASKPLDLPEALVFETGANRWRFLDAWPPPEAETRSLYLHTEGGLSFSSPATAHLGAEGVGPVDDEFRSEAFTSWVSDPQKPVPYTTEIRTRWSREYMTADQRFASRRPDVLVFTSEPLKQDLTIAGPLEAKLFVSTSAQDADWVVKVIDFYPDAPTADRPPWAQSRGEDGEVVERGGLQQMVRGEIFRGRFRESYAEPKPFEPGAVTEVNFRLHDVLHTFKRGHRVMVQVQSSWFPYIDRNPQSWVPNIFEAEEEDFVRAIHRVYHSEQYPTRIEVGVLDD